jgi:uncharacterized double-CXXCG motif protein
LNLPDYLTPEPYVNRFPVTPERQFELQAALLKAWGINVLLWPGTDFGPLVGSASGKPGDFIWANSWTPLISTKAANLIHAAGVLGLSLVESHIKWRSKKTEQLLELQISPGVRLSAKYLEALGASRCTKCRILRWEKELPNRHERLAQAALEYSPVLDAKSLPEEWDLLRIEEWESQIIASERFRNGVARTGLTNVTFRELEASNS